MILALALLMSSFALAQEPTKDFSEIREQLPEDVKKAFDDWAKDEGKYPNQIHLVKDYNFFSHKYRPEVIGTIIKALRQANFQQEYLSGLDRLHSTLTRSPNLKKTISTFKRIYSKEKLLPPTHITTDGATVTNDRKSIIYMQLKDEFFYLDLKDPNKIWRACQNPASARTRFESAAYYSGMRYTNNS